MGSGKGDCITDSWLLATMDEYYVNDPATIAYGPSRDAAFQTLMNGRFTVEPTTSIWAAASIWQDYLP